MPANVLNKFLDVIIFTTDMLLFLNNHLQGHFKQPRTTTTNTTQTHTLRGDEDGIARTRIVSLANHHPTHSFIHPFIQY